MFNECATSAFKRQGSDRYIGHWSLLPHRATEPIAASLILNIAIKANFDNLKFYSVFKYRAKNHAL